MWRIADPLVKCLHLVENTTAFLVTGVHMPVLRSYSYLPL